MNNTSRKKQSLFIILIIANITILILLFGATFSYFKNNKVSEGEIRLGELDFTIQTTTSQNIIMPGDKVNVDAKIINKVSGKNQLIPFYFRFRLTDNENFTANVNLNDYILGKNNFYYCKHKILPNASKQLFTTITIDGELTAGKQLNVAIYVEAVQSEYQAYQEIFEDAPLEWIEFIENN